MGTHRQAALGGIATPTQQVDRRIETQLLLTPCPPFGQGCLHRIGDVVHGIMLHTAAARVNVPAGPAPGSDPAPESWVGPRFPPSR